MRATHRNKGKFGQSQGTESYVTLEEEYCLSMRALAPSFRYSKYTQGVSVYKEKH